MEAFVDIRTAGRLANRVKTALPQLGLQKMDRLEVGPPLTEPGWQTRTGRLDLNKHEPILPNEANGTIKNTNVPFWA